MVSRLTLTSIRKYYGDKLALEMDELALEAGRLYILTGPNGSGKSTLLNILALLVRPERGDIYFDGECVTWNRDTLNLLRRRVTLLHQSPYLFVGSVFSNVAFGLKVRGVTGERLKQGVLDSLDKVDLAGIEERDVKHLSGGEAQRVALSRALAFRPEILLLDEPLANVDSRSAEIIERLIASLSAEGTTVVMSTHNPLHNERLEGDEIRLLGGRLD